MATAWAECTLPAVVAVVMGVGAHCWLSPRLGPRSQEVLGDEVLLGPALPARPGPRSSCFIVAGSALRGPVSVVRVPGGPATALRGPRAALWVRSAGGDVL